MKKQEIIEKYLIKYPELSTKDIQQYIMDGSNIIVSSRSIQRIRRELEKVTNKKEDVFDTKEENKQTNLTHHNGNVGITNYPGLSEMDISILNLANEGGWSVEEIAEELGTSPEKVKQCLFNLKHMVRMDVIDEKSPNVYLDLSEGQDNIIEDLDSLSYKAPVFTIQKKEDEFWEVKQDCVTACSKVDNDVNVFMNLYSRRRAMLYMKWAGAREWLAYLVGEFKDGAYYITDLYLPDQRTSATLVDEVNNDDFNKRPIVGVIHSHHEMGAGDENRPSFSGHDEAFINSNHNLSLLAGRDRQGGGFKIVGIARTKTPCGAFIKVKAVIKSMNEDPDGDKKLKDEFLKKTQTQTQTHQYNFAQYSYPKYDGNQQISGNNCSNFYIRKNGFYRHN